MKIENFLKIFIALLVLIVSIRFFQSRLLLSDLQVYYGASKKLFLGQNPYEGYYGLSNGFYKYAPFFLILFYPISLIPWSILIFIYPLITLCGLYVFFKKFNLNYALILSIILHSHNIYREVLIGNINIFLMLFLVYFVIFDAKNKIFISSIFLSFLILIKPHFIFLLIFILFHKKIKTLLYFFIISIILTCIPIIFLGYSHNTELIRNWIQAMSSHNSAIGYITHPLNIQYILWKTMDIIGINTSHINKIYFIDSIILIIPLIILTMKLPFNFSVYCLSALLPFILLVDSNQLIYALPFCIISIDRFLSTIEKIDFHLCAFVALFIFVLLTQQIPKSYLPLNNFIGVAYLLFFMVIVSVPVPILTSTGGLNYGKGNS